ncbi:COX15/CtaA family protein [Acidipropionibacterium jensenii]|uniref:COX15/CtaA family protein n=1 Tax=Acidipropionibacterium jensenii TaxID=1749 RepID=UPI00214B1002|nr:COX15/CtaA family protein [Acidipropionibacterium jensenii]
MGVLNRLSATREALHGWVLATLAANMLLIVSGAVVRLTGSGLGCPTWPHCAAGSFVPHESMGIHGAIEFGNRLLTFVLLLTSAMAVVAATRTRAAGNVRTLAWVALVAIPVQAVIGGLSVLAGLNPFIVALHLLLSVAIILVAVKLVWVVGRHETAEVDGLAMGLVRAVVAATLVVMWLGTIVTGSGPNAGDAGARRTGFHLETVTRLHSISVWILVILTVAALLVATGRRIAPMRRWALILLGVEIFQAVIGYAQYFAHLNPWLVIWHMVGVSLCAAATGALWAGIRPFQAPDLAPPRQS